MTRRVYPLAATTVNALDAVRSVVSNGGTVDVLKDDTGRVIGIFPSRGEAAEVKSKLDARQCDLRKKNGYRDSVACKHR